MTGCLMNSRIIVALAVASFFGLESYSPYTKAQDSDLKSALMETCNVRGSVTITVLDIPVTTPLICANQSKESAPGDDVSDLAGTSIVDVPGIANLATIQAPSGESLWVDSTSTTTLFGDASASELNLLQGNIQVADVDGWALCNSSTGSAETVCGLGMKLGSLLVNGQPVAIPSQPIPFNYGVAISGIVIQVNVLGVIYRVPLSGSLVLNKVTLANNDTTSPDLAYAPVSLSLSGAVDGPGGSKLGVDLQLDDYAEANLISWTQDNNMIYNYCADAKRFPGGLPPECTSP